jgi:hypothetical protein
VQVISTYSTRRTIAAGLVLALVGLPCGNARAEANQECEAAYEQTQVLRDIGKLVEARKRALVCVSSACAAVVVKECAQWLSEMDQRLPTVVFAAQDATGADTLRVRVSLDGEPIPEALDGRSVALDPGPHKLRFEMVGVDPVDQNVIIRQGEKNRRIAVSFKTRDTSSPPSHVPAWAWATGAAGIAFTGAGVGFLIWSTKTTCRMNAKGECTDGSAGSTNTTIDIGRGLAAGFGRGRSRRHRGGYRRHHFNQKSALSSRRRPRCSHRRPEGAGRNRRRKLLMALSESE